jgi:hypothetical protein
MLCNRMSLYSGQCRAYPRSYCISLFPVDDARRRTSHRVGQSWNYDHIFRKVDQQANMSHPSLYLFQSIPSIILSLSIYYKVNPCIILYSSIDTNTLRSCSFDKKHPTNYTLSSNV